MDTKLLLVKSITLLYRESQLADGKNSADIVSAVLDVLKAPEGYTINSAEFGKDTISALRETTRWMAHNEPTTTYDKSELLQRLRVNVGNDNGLFDALFNGIEPEHGEDGLKRLCLSYREALRLFLTQQRLRDTMKKYYTQLWFQPSTIDWGHYVKDIREELVQFESSNAGPSVLPHLVTEIDFNNASSVQSAIEKGRQDVTPVGVLRTGLQGLNRMMGKVGGFQRGDFILTSGLPFNYKSGLALDITRHIIRYNVPSLWNIEKKPMVVRISLENKAESDVMALYKSMVEIEEGIPVDLTAIDPEEATRYVLGKIQENGWNLKIYRFTSSDFTYRDLFDLIESLEADGYEIVFLSIDYLNLMSKKGCTMGAQGAEIRDLFRRVRNFTNPRGITFLTPHQLSPDARMLARAGVPELVKNLPGKGFYDSCKSIDQEADIEIHHHIEVINGISYLTFQRGKHRTQVGVTPIRDQYFAQQFQELGGLVDDVNGPDMSLRTVGGNPNSQGGGSAWWDDAA